MDWDPDKVVSWTCGCVFERLLGGERVHDLGSFVRWS